tara:strand:+ start:252 stop:752 length:501 start_codon:yes stop_codon:yes gene_type:complete
MWIIAKHKTKELNLLKNNLTEIFGENIKFYNPKIKYQKYVKNKLETLERYVLGNYIFFYHEKLKDEDCLAKLKFTKGLEYVLKNFKYNQIEIQAFINYCKQYEDKSGYLTQDFFKNSSMKKGKFISGPFTNMIFSIISEQKTKLKILIGNITTTISKKSGYLYQPV